MQIGLGLDGRLRLSEADHDAIAREAAALGYTSLWTPAREDDPFERCVRWHRASGLATGISVLPLQLWDRDRLIAGARAAAAATGGTFVLGVGAGSLRDAPIRRLRELAADLRAGLPGVPLYLGALGPQMLRLAGGHYDGAALNWCSAEQTAWSRERVAAGARAAGRDPADVRIHQYLRVCVDADVAAARRALAEMTLGYALARPGGDPTKGYRAHFARMGFDAALREIEARRDAGASPAEQAALLPDDLLARTGWWGPPADAAAGFRALARGLDVAVVRVVASRDPGIAGVRLALRSCAGAI
jgi:hypothetical protein